MFEPLRHLQRILMLPRSRSVAALSIGVILAAGSSRAETVFPHSGRYGHTAICDSAHHRMVVFGGTDANS